MAEFVIAVMILGAVSMWTVIPFGWIWIGSRLSHTQAPSGGPYMVVFFGIVCSIIAMAWVLSRLNRLYVRITGSDQLRERYLPAGGRASATSARCRTGMSVLEAVILSSVLLAARRDGRLVLHRRRLPAAQPVATDWSVNAIG